MKLIRINNYRCGDWDSCLHVFAPDNKTTDEIDKDVDSCCDQMIADATRAVKDRPRPKQPEWSFKHYSDETTVKEIKALHEVYNKEYEKWRDQEALKKMKYTDYLRKLGYLTPEWMEFDEDDNTFDVYWGHQHGLSLDYT